MTLSWALDAMFGVGPFEHAGAGQHVGGELVLRVTNGADHDVRVESGHGPSQAIGFGDRDERVPAEREEDPHGAGFDLVRQGGAGMLGQEAGDIGPAGRARLAVVEDAGPDRRVVAPLEVPGVAPHPAGTVERPGEQQ